MVYTRQILFIVLIIIISIYFHLSVYEKAESDSIQQLNKEQFTHARQISNYLETAVKEYENNLEYCSKREDIINLNNEGKKLITHIYNLHHGKMGAVSLIDSTGSIYFTYPYSKEILGYNLSYREYFRKLSKTHSPSISSLFLLFGQFNSIVLYYPIFKNGVFAGGIGSFIPYEELTENALKELKINRSGYSWIIDQDGNILYHPKQEYRGKNSFDVFKNSPSVNNMLKKAAAGMPGTAELNMKFGSKEETETIYNIYYPIPVADEHWSIIMAAPKKEISSMMKGFLFRLIIIFTFLTGGVLIYFYYIIKARSVIKEERLRKQAEADLINSEKKFKKLVDVSPDAILLMNLEGKIIICNQMAARLMGYNDSYELIGLDSLQFFTSEDKSRALDNFKITVTGGITREYQYNMIRKDGTVFPAELSTAVITDMNDNPIGFAGILRDITERKKIEQMLLDAKEAAEGSDRFKSEFLAQMSHEIRSPINAILSFAGLLQDEIYDIVPKDLKDSFSIMKNAGKRIIRTVDLILNMSELETGTFEPSYRTVKLIDDVIDQVYLEFTQTARDRGLEFNLINQSGYKEINLTGDEYTLGQIFNNLVNNAIKFTGRGKVEVIVLINDEGKIVVKVCDTGIGISEDYLKNLFKAFSQEEQGYSRRFEGNGLGLALVKKYCVINNASIEVESVKEKGTTFSVIFNDLNYTTDK